MAMNPDTNRMEPVYAATDEHAESLLTALEKTKGQLYRADGSTVPEHWSVFTIGEVITANGYMFRVAYMGETSLLLEPVGPAVTEREPCAKPPESTPIRPR